MIIYCLKSILKIKTQWLPALSLEGPGLVWHRFAWKWTTSMCCRGCATASRTTRQENFPSHSHGKAQAGPLNALEKPMAGHAVRRKGKPPWMEAAQCPFLQMSTHRVMDLPRIPGLLPVQRRGVGIGLTSVGPLLHWRWQSNSGTTQTVCESRGNTICLLKSPMS